MQEHDNAFEILTKDTGKIKNYQMKSRMMHAIVDTLKKKGWTQATAAVHLKVSQPRISDLMNGRLSKFSIDMLMGMLTELGYSFEFNYTPTNNKITLSMFVKNNRAG